MRISCMEKSCMEKKEGVDRAADVVRIRLLYVLVCETKGFVSAR